MQILSIYNYEMDKLIRIEVDQAAISANVKTCLSIIKTPIIGVVKANAYGFGAIETAKTMLDAGVPALAAARVCEAVQLREAGISAPILVFNPYGTEEIDQSIQNKITLSLNTFETFRTIETRCKALNKTASIHLKIDTGMGRFGFLPDEVPAMLDMLSQAPSINMDGIYSHFALIDDDPLNPFNTTQKERFEAVLQMCRSRNMLPRWIHFANSAAALSSPETRYNSVRMGAALLGINPFYYAPFPDYLKRVLSWKTVLTSVRRLPAGWGISYGQTFHLIEDSWIGMIPVGYADGFRRSEKNEVLIRGKRTPIVGRVCTDACMALLPQKAPIGEEVVLIGEQGDESIQIEDLADRWDIARANVICGIHTRG